MQCWKRNCNICKISKYFVCNQKGSRRNVCRNKGFLILNPYKLHKKLKLTIHSNNLKPCYHPVPNTVEVTLHPGTLVILHKLLSKTQKSCSCTVSVKFSLVHHLETVGFYNHPCSSVMNFQQLPPCFHLIECHGFFVFFFWKILIVQSDQRLRAAKRPNPLLSVSPAATRPTQPQTWWWKSVRMSICQAHCNVTRLLSNNSTRRILIGWVKRGFMNPL